MADECKTATGTGMTLRNGKEISAPLTRYGTCRTCGDSVPASSMWVRTVTDRVVCAPCNKKFTEAQQPCCDARSCTILYSCRGCGVRMCDNTVVCEVTPEKYLDTYCVECHHVNCHNDRTGVY